MLIGMDCENSTGAHLDDAVGENGSVLTVMRDVHRRQTECALKPCEFRSQVCTQFRIEAREGLVQQQHARLTNDRACECDTLLFAA